MALTQFADGSFFVPIRSGQRCPVCSSKKGRCSEFYNQEGKKVLYRCKYKTSERPSNGWYLHLVKDIDGINPSEVEFQVLPEIKEVELTQETLELRNKVYRRFRELIKKYEGSYLQKEDMKELLSRGLNENQILKMGFFSVPSTKKKVWSDKGNHKIKLTTAITKTLTEEFGPENLLKVPGFIKCKNKNGGEFVSFKTSIKDSNEDSFRDIRGYFIPYHNVQGLLVALQYRLTEPVYDERGKKMRYFWYSSTQARSGSPIDCYLPDVVRKEDILLVTEGATKGKIACEKLGYQGLFEAGVSNYRRLLKNIQALEHFTGMRYKIILALDMDKDENEEVQRAEECTISMLKATGHQIAVAYWDGKKAKGIDDALQMNLNISYKLI